MRLGVLKITHELMASPQWDKMFDEIKKHFTEQDRKWNPWGPYWEIIGTSDQFDDLPEAVCAQDYIPIFKDSPKIELQEFQRCN